MLSVTKYFMKNRLSLSTAREKFENEKELPYINYNSR